MNQTKSNDIISNIHNIILDEIMCIILSYLPHSKRKLLNKDSYSSSYTKNIPLQLKISFETYIRKIVSSDFDFVFNILLNNNFTRWIHMKKYRHNQMIFINYIYFLKYISQENNSNECLKLINNIIDITDLNGKQHKNKINRNIIWIK